MKLHRFAGSSCQSEQFCMCYKILGLLLRMSPHVQLNQLKSCGEEVTYITLIMLYVFDIQSTVHLDIFL